jgi:transcriptional regulator with XRE-family HTH domain
LGVTSVTEEPQREQEPWAHDGHFGERVARLRSLRGLSREELAKEADISKTTLIRFESNGLPRSGVDLRNLCQALGTTPGFLLLGDE